MAEMFQTIAALMWMALSVVVFVKIRKWNKKFNDLYESMKSQLVDEEADNNCGADMRGDTDGV